MELREFAEYINQLDENATPVWGRMTPQHMVEHLTNTLRLATGEIEIPVYTPENQLASMRNFLMSNRAIPRGVVSPAVGGSLPKLKNSSFEEARKEFWEKYDAFEKYYEDNPDNTHANPAFGDLNKEEWKQFMKKHFTHHFEQFGLIPDTSQ
jgi:oxepin-CoA hydrolase/3-oxo-5,6-dehydrosuberyl-CoA semialdehyde dehydrogenase